MGTFFSIKISDITIDLRVISFHHCFDATAKPMMDIFWFYRFLFFRLFKKVFYNPLPYLVLF